MQNSHVLLTKNTDGTLCASSYSSARNYTVFLGDYNPGRNHHFFTDSNMFISWAENEAYLSRVKFINAID